MDLISYCLNEIRMQIPHEVLSAAFTIDEPPEVVNITSLDEKITTKVLKKRVFQDCNILGGIEIIVPLNNIQPLYYENFYTVYKIPNELTLNREIISALNITTMPGTGLIGSIGLNYDTFAGILTNSYSAVANISNRIGDAAAPSGAVSNAHIEVIGPNTLLVYANYRLLTNFGVRVVVENNPNFTNISPRSYKAFSMMCVLAVKSYIYNKLIIPINSGYLAAGQELGVFKSIVESYENTEEEYRTYLNEKMGAVLYMNDTTRYNRFLRSMIAPDI